MLINKSRVLTLFILFTIASINCQAQPTLKFPVDCVGGENCWVVNYVDVEPATNVIKDFSCGTRSYDQHKGTDIAIADWRTMKQGVDILAAADGKVLRVRDGVKDAVLSRQQLDKIKAENKSCGNGIFIEHGEGWQTIYCHLKQNSIVVEPNQIVRAGQKLAQLGHSGYVEFPHLHIGVMHNDTPIDPYTGSSNQDGCRNSNQAQPLWFDRKHAGYRPISLYAAGFSDVVPTFEQIKQDISSPDSLSTDSSALTFWVSIFGVQKNDQIQLEIRDPKGRIFSNRSVVQKETRARQFLFIGKKNSSGAFVKGEYIGLVTLKRKLSNGEILERALRKELNIK